MEGVEMTTESQRIAMAEFCGISQLQTTLDVLWGVRAGNDICVVPDYLNDLNAVHEAEEMLTEDQFGSYKEHLIDVVFAEVETRRGILCATAAQKCEAILKALNLWKDAP